MEVEIENQKRKLAESQILIKDLGNKREALAGQVRECLGQIADRSQLEKLQKEFQQRIQQLEQLVESCRARVAEKDSQIGGQQTQIYRLEQQIESLLLQRNDTEAYQVLQDKKKSQKVEQLQ